MEKNWLIRTKSNHILGPVSKEKVQELYQNGSIKADDEICSGNGYWFFIRELDLVNKYLMGTHSQSFNPISEAKDVLTVKEHDSVDLESPVKDDITIVGNLNLAQLRSEEVHQQKVSNNQDNQKTSTDARVSQEIQKKK
jgi:hypothetical protein